MAMAIVLDDMEMYKKAIDIYLYGYENGSIRYYIDGETGQCQESGRDRKTFLFPNRYILRWLQ